MTKNERFTRLLVCSVIWGALVVPLTSAALLVALDSHRDSVDSELRAVLPWSFLFEAVPATLLSVLGGVWLGAVGVNTRRSVHLAMHGLCAGAVLSFPFCIFGLLGSGHGTGGDVGSFVLFTVLVGAANGLAYALVFRRFFLHATLS